MCYVYILKCKDDTYYTGWTNNLEKRINAHNKGIGAKYTKYRRPVEYVFTHKCIDKIQAMQYEYKIKQFSRVKKTKLIKGEIKL
ncbi:MAG: GIY-YIG nuclease family protein [Tissierellia bacterium]|nr:GIY-YIG nuclease family protein [Tissierellia bacterium]